MRQGFEIDPSCVTKKMQNLTEEINEQYRPYRASGLGWVSQVEFDNVREFGAGHPPIRVLILYGSLRTRSFSRLLAYEYARLLESLGADVRVFNPEGLPMKDDKSEKHEKVVEIRDLSLWSEGQIWVSPEQHGAITAVFKNQVRSEISFFAFHIINAILSKIDWIPLSLGSVRPTQGRTLAVSQINGGSQSFNAVNTLRLLGRWMRMFAIPNQSSVPKAWTEFDSNDRMKDSSYRDRVVDVAEEFFKMTILLRPQASFLVDRFSERKEVMEKGRLLSQAEKERIVPQIQ